MWLCVDTIYKQAPPIETTSRICTARNDIVAKRYFKLNHNYYNDIYLLEGYARVSTLTGHVR